MRERVLKKEEEPPDPKKLWENNRGKVINEGA